MNEDIRFHQRFQNLEKAVQFLKDSVSQGDYNKLEAAGLAQSFEFTFELAWKTLKDFLVQEGFQVRSPRETIKQGFQEGWIEDGHLWIKMLEERNRLTHTYNEEQAAEAVRIIREEYFPALFVLYKTLKKEV